MKKSQKDLIFYFMEEIQLNDESENSLYNQQEKLLSELEEIPGVGEKTIELLLKKLKSVKRVKEANLETLEEILGKQKGKIIWEFFNQ